jgi:hypothetical protein
MEAEMDLAVAFEVGECWISEMELAGNRGVNNVASPGHEAVSSEDVPCLACSALARVCIRYACLFALDAVVTVQNLFDFGRFKRSRTSSNSPFSNVTRSLKEHTYSPSPCAKSLVLPRVV